MKSRLVWQDLGRVICGTGAFLYYLLSKESIDIGLGTFSAELSVVVPGQPTKYYARIANVVGEVQDVKLAICVAIPEPQATRYAYFMKSLAVKPHSATAIEVEYDWLTKACFFIDGFSSSPDEFSKGEVDSPQLYSVTAILFDSQGSTVDRLTVFQELTR